MIDLRALDVVIMCELILDTQILFLSISRVFTRSNVMKGRCKDCWYFDKGRNKSPYDTQYCLHPDNYDIKLDRGFNGDYINSRIWSEPKKLNPNANCTRWVKNSFYWGFKGKKIFIELCKEKSITWYKFNWYECMYRNHHVLGIWKNDNLHRRIPPEGFKRPSGYHLIVFTDDKYTEEEENIMKQDRENESRDNARWMHFSCDHDSYRYLPWP